MLRSSDAGGAILIASMNAKKSWNWSLWIGFLCALAGFFSLHILRAIPNYTRFSVGESLVVCCGRDFARAGSVPSLWQTAGLSGQNLRTDFGRARRYRCSVSFLIYSSMNCGRSRLRPERRELGKKLPSSRCRIKMGRTYLFSDLISRSKAVALIFYRGFW